MNSEDYPKEKLIELGPIRFRVFLGLNWLDWTTPHFGVTFGRDWYCYVEAGPVALGIATAGPKSLVIVRN